MSISKEERLAELQQERAALEERLRQILSKAGLPLEQVLGIIKKLEDVEESIKIVEECEC